MYFNVLNKIITIHNSIIKSNKKKILLFYIFLILILVNNNYCVITNDINNMKKQMSIVNIITLQITHSPILDHTFLLFNYKYLKTAPFNIFKYIYF